MGWGRSRRGVSHHLAGGVEALDTGEISRISGIGLRPPWRDSLEINGLEPDRADRAM